jgi:hypothetical protein
VALSLSVGCAARVGDMRANIGIPSPWVAPSRPAEPTPRPEPSRPGDFPEVQLVWTNALYPNDAPPPVIVAAVTPTAAIEPMRPNPVEPVEPDPVEPVEPSPVEPGPEPTPADEPTPRVETQSAEEVLAASGIILPYLHADASPEETKFHEQSIRAVEKTYVEDFDDPSVLLSLYEKMMTDEGLSYLAEDWRVPLELTIARAETLQRVNAPLRALRRVFERAKPGSQTGLYLQINQPGCRSAFAQLTKLDTDALDIYVTIQQIGRHTLRDVETICTESDEAELASREFPEQEGAPSLRRLVRKAYNRAYRGSGKKVRKVVVLQGGWEVLEEEKQRLLHAIVGVKRKRAFPHAPCVMEEITIAQEEKNRPGKYGPPICCQIKSSVAISCDQLK